MLHKALADYEALKTLIEERQAFETAHPIPPYINHPTTVNYLNTNGLSLLHLAASAGDLEKVKECIARGAELNLESVNQQLPIASALKSGQLEVAKHLLDLGAHCRSVKLADCSNDECKKWFLNELEKGFNKTFDNIKNDPSSINKFLWDDNQFFSSSSGIPILHRLLELEKFELISKLNKFNAKNDLTVLTAAIEHNSTPLISSLMADIKKDDLNQPYIQQPLHAAVNKGDVELTKKLLSKGANVNAQNSLKETALILACSGNDEKLVKLLLENNPDMTLKTIDGDTALHTAAKNQNPKIYSTLAQHPMFEEMKKIKNIYGEIPLNIALKYKNDEVINLLSPNDLNDIKKSKQYGSITTINQATIINNFSYYLKSHYRDAEFFSPKGYCNGFSHLSSLYSEDYFFDTLRLLASWDKSSNMLEKSFPPDLPQAKYYKNLGELFEQWINDLTVFQATSTESIFDIKIRERKKQHQLISTDKGYEPIPLYLEDFAIFSEQLRSKEQLSEMLKWLLRMPEGSKFDISGGNHTVAAALDQAHQIKYYDPNFDDKLNTIENADELLERIIDYKYIAFKKFGAVFDLQFLVFCFAKDKNLMDFERFEVFKESELPKSKDEATVFQQNSPNRLTHLHVATLTHSLGSIKRLLTDGHCDVSAKDAFGRTVLDLVATPNFLQENIIDVFLESANKAVNFQNVLLHAVELNNIEVVNKLLMKNIVNINEKYEGKVSFVLEQAVKNDNLPLIRLLIQYDADVRNLTVEILLNENYRDVLLPALKDINFKDLSGDTVLHRACQLNNTALFTYLISRSADPNIENSRGMSAVDIIFNFLDSGRFINPETKEQQYTWLAVLLPQLDKKRLFNSLLFYVGAELTTNETEQKFFTLLLEKCKDDKSILNARDAHDTSLLFRALMKLNVLAFEKLLKIGCDPNVLLMPSENNLLIALLKNNNYPQNERIKLISLLLDNGIDLKHVNKAGESAQSLVEKIDNEKITALFIDRGLISKPTDSSAPSPH